MAYISIFNVVLHQKHIDLQHSLPLNLMKLLPPDSLLISVPILSLCPWKFFLLYFKMNYSYVRHNTNPSQILRFAKMIFILLDSSVVVLTEDLCFSVGTKLLHPHVAELVYFRKDLKKLKRSVKVVSEIWMGKDGVVTGSQRSRLHGKSHLTWAVAICRGTHLAEDKPAHRQRNEVGGGVNITSACSVCKFPSDATTQLLKLSSLQLSIISKFWRYQSPTGVFWIWIQGVVGHCVQYASVLIVAAGGHLYTLFRVSSFVSKESRKHLQVFVGLGLFPVSSYLLLLTVLPSVYKITMRTALNTLRSFSSSHL